MLEYHGSSRFACQLKCMLSIKQNWHFTHYKWNLFLTFYLNHVHVPCVFLWRCFREWHRTEERQLNKVSIFCTQKVLLMLHEMNNCSHMDYFKNVFSIFLLLESASCVAVYWGGPKAHRLHLNLCSDEQRSYRCGTIWGWGTNNIILFFSELSISVMIINKL